MLFTASLLMLRGNLRITIAGAGRTSSENVDGSEVLGANDGLCASPGRFELCRSVGLESPKVCAEDSGEVMPDPKVSERKDGLCAAMVDEP